MAASVLCEKKIPLIYIPNFDSYIRSKHLHGYWYFVKVRSFVLVLLRHSCVWLNGFNWNPLFPKNILLLVYVCIMYVFCWAYYVRRYTHTHTCVYRRTFFHFLKNQATRPIKRIPVFSFFLPSHSLLKASRYDQRSKWKKTCILPSSLKYKKHETKMTCLYVAYEPNRAMGKTQLLCSIKSFFVDCWRSSS